MFLGLGQNCYYIYTVYIAVLFWVTVSVIIQSWGSATEAGSMHSMQVVKTCNKILCFNVCFRMTFVQKKVQYIFLGFQTKPIIDMYVKLCHFNFNFSFFKWLNIQRVS